MRRSSGRVHLQKERLRPASALLKLARANLETYLSPHERLDLKCVLELIENFLARLEESELSSNPLKTMGRPQLSLLEPNNPVETASPGSS